MLNSITILHNRLILLQNKLIYLFIYRLLILETFIYNTAVIEFNNFNKHLHIYML